LSSGGDNQDAYANEALDEWAAAVTALDSDDQLAEWLDRIK